MPGFPSRAIRRTPPLTPTRTFQALGLAEPLLRALAARNYTTPTPIQERAIPPLLAGKDLLGIAQTGTGKTAAFALPILQLLAARKTPAEPQRPHTLVLAPTRELAAQIGDSFAGYGQHLRLRHTVIFGGVGQAPQVQALRRGIDVLVATPGRLLDLMQQRLVDLRSVSIFVLDEADRMLDMGFLPDVRRVVDALPKQRQTLLFSATMPDEIASLASRILVQPLRVEVTPQATTVERIEQRLYHCKKADKRDLLGRVLADQSIERALVFTRTKHGADRVAKHLHKIGVPSAAIHGDKRQTARERALEQFRDGGIRVLVATDIAARGIDVKEITHVVNFDLPNIPESYVHRIGRTARAGRDGVAISFCDETEREYLRDIEKLIRRKLDVVGGTPPPAPAPAEPARGPARRGQGGHRQAPAPHGRRSSPNPQHAPAPTRPVVEAQFGVGVEAGADRQAPRVANPWAAEGGRPKGSGQGGAGKGHGQGHAHGSGGGSGGRGHGPQQGQNPGQAPGQAPRQGHGSGHPPHGRSRRRRR